MHHPINSRHCGNQITLGMRIHSNLDYHELPKQNVQVKVQQWGMRSIIYVYVQPLFAMFM